MPFGLKGIVLDFNCVSAALLAICRRWLALPALAFYDDIRVAELVGSCPSGSDSLNELFEWLGFRHDPTKHQKPSSSIVFLGTLEASMCDGDPELFGLLPMPGRVENILKDVGVLVSKIFASSGELASSRGRLLHLLSTMSGRMVQILTAGISKLLQGGGGQLSDKIYIDFLWLRALLAWTPFTSPIHHEWKNGANSYGWYLKITSRRRRTFVGQNLHRLLVAPRAFGLDSLQKSSAGFLHAKSRHH